MQPWSRLFLSTAIDHLIKDASGGGTTSEREPGPVPCEDMLREDGQTISLHSFILVPMPPNCHHTKGWLQPFNPPWNWWLSQHLPSFCIPWCHPGVSMGHFGIVCGYLYDFQVLPLQNGWPQPFNPPLSQHLPSFCIPWCQPWRFNGPFWNSVWLLVWFPSAATIKWLAPTFQPTMKLVVGPAPAMLWGWNCRGSWVFNPITNLKLGWWVEASHLIVARFGKLCK